MRALAPAVGAIVLLLLAASASAYDLQYVSISPIGYSSGGGYSSGDALGISGSSQLGFQYLIVSTITTATQAAASQNGGMPPPARFAEAVGHVLESPDGDMYLVLGIAAILALLLLVARRRRKKKS